VTHELLAIPPVVVVIAGFAWMTYVAWEIHRNTLAGAASGYQESEQPAWRSAD
jgi:hypothetical protein